MGLPKNNCVALRLALLEHVLPQQADSSFEARASNVRGLYNKGQRADRWRSRTISEAANAPTELPKHNNEEGIHGAYLLVIVKSFEPLQQTRLTTTAGRGSTVWSSRREDLGKRSIDAFGVPSEFYLQDNNKFWR